MLVADWTVRAPGEDDSQAVARPLQLVPPSSLPPAHRRADELGFDLEYTERVLPFMEWLYRSYFRVEAEGIGNVPGNGRGLLVANHGGVVPWDGAMVRTAIRLEHPSRRHARMLVLDWAFSVPFLSQFLARTGNVLAHPDNAVHLLRQSWRVRPSRADSSSLLGGKNSKENVRPRARSSGMRAIQDRLATPLWFASPRGTPGSGGRPPACVRRRSWCSPAAC